MPYLYENHKEQIKERNLKYYHNKKNDNPDFNIEYNRRNRAMWNFRQYKKFQEILKNPNSNKIEAEAFHKKLQSYKNKVKKEGFDDLIAILE